MNITKIRETHKTSKKRNLTERWKNIRKKYVAINIKQDVYSSGKKILSTNHVQTYSLYATLNKVFFNKPPDEILVVRPK